MVRMDILAVICFYHIVSGFWQKDRVAFHQILKLFFGQDSLELGSAAQLPFLPKYRR